MSEAQLGPRCNNEFSASDATNSRCAGVEVLINIVIRCAWIEFAMLSRKEALVFVRRALLAHTYRLGETDTVVFGWYIDLRNT